MSFYDELQSATETSRQYLLSAPIIADVMSRQFSLATYGAFLNQAYYHVRHTIPLLMLAGGRLSATQQWLQAPIARYIAEELGHEAWILDDMANCGWDRRVVSAGEAPYHSDLLVAYLYDTVQRRNAVGIFGMVQVLEGTSASLAPMVANIVQEHLALPDSAMTYLTTHGELDQSHLDHFRSVMDKVEDSVDRSDIVTVANRVYRIYGDIYRDIPAEASRFESTAEWAA